jgi:uncharacterized protein YutE (UPF0331/DUF86 family)
MPTLRSSCAPAPRGTFAPLAVSRLHWNLPSGAPSTWCSSTRRAPLAYRIFRDGHLLVERDHGALVTRKARVLLDYLDWKPVEERWEFCAPLPPVVDSALLAATIAAVRDATARVRAVLPTSVEAFVADRTTREVVTLNIFVAIQDCLDLAAHWLADAEWEMPGAYADVFTALARHAVIPHELATRLAAAAAFRNLVAHQDGVLDWRRVYALASSDLGDLDRFCATLAARIRDQA